MKVLLAAINSKYIHTNISLRYLEKSARFLPYECVRKEFTINENLTRILEEIMEVKPDLIGFSVYIWNFEMVKELSVLIKRIDEKIKILYGGPEVSYDSKKHLEIMAGDFIIRGEGEKSYEDLIGSLLLGKNLEEVSGLTYRSGDEVKSNAPREKMDLSLVPFPYEEGEDLTDKIAYTEASRGCPYMCSYCLSSSERDLRFLPYDKVVENIEKLLKTGTRMIKFIDRTFNIHPDAYKIWAYLINLDDQVTFHFEISPDLIKAEHLELLAKSPLGRIQFEVGIQSTEKLVLQEINRYITFGKVRETLIGLGRLKNIHTHMDLIAGLPNDTLDSFRKSFNDVYALRPEMLQLGFLKVIKGTPMERDALKYGIVYSPYAPYEVLKTNWMSYDDLRYLHRTEEVLDRYYNSGRFQHTLDYVLKEEKEPMNFYGGLGTYYKDQGFYEKIPGVKDFYRILKEFTLIWNDTHGSTLDSKLFNELLKFDYLQYNKKQFLPEFIERNYLPNNDLKQKLSKELGKKIHVELYHLDILLYLETGKIVDTETPVVYDEETGKIITKTLSNFMA
ncbi:MAG: DUF4080 domain-containing protein [Clostridiaceae bacterium]